MKTTTLTISNPISDSLLRCALILIPFVLICVATLPGAHAVSPPPDGGYPNFNTAEGQSALFSLTTGSANTAVGWFSLSTNAAGSFNTATGAGSLLFNTADQNTAFGAAALLFNITGINNTAVGAAALSNNTTADGNTANGAFALFSNTEGVVNTASGAAALSSNTTGSNNTAYGEEALENSNNNHNTAVGSSALRSNTTGSVNTALGSFAGINVTTADHVICIGINGENVSDSCFIGNIRGVTTANADAVPVLIDSAGQLGTASSSRRFKKEIQPMDKASEAILALKPVTFHYKSDAKGTPQFGLIAEEVAKVNPDLVVRDEKGEIYTVRYDAVNAMLLNEFLKEHRKVENLRNDFQATVAQQQKHLVQQQQQIEVLTGQLKEQAAYFQKVSAQLAAASPSGGGLEANKPARQVVNNP
jgi:Chaperone of endosialidase